MPLTLIGTLFEIKTLDPLPPTEAREYFFGGIASQEFTSPLVTHYTDVFSRPCPKCDRMNNSVKWVTPEGTGYAQTKFSHKCESCGNDFNKEMIGIRRCANEIATLRAGQTLFFS